MKNISGKELEKILHAINKLDAKCNDSRLSLIYNFVMELIENGKIDMDNYEKEIKRELEITE